MLSKQLAVSGHQLAADQIANFDFLLTEILQDPAYSESLALTWKVALPACLHQVPCKQYTLHQIFMGSVIHRLLRA